VALDQQDAGLFEPLGLCHEKGAVSLAP